jgi:tetratricopeptide (TPR) repeat protein
MTRHAEKLLAASAIALELAAIALLWAAQAPGAAVAHALGAAAAAASLTRRAGRLGLAGRGAWLLCAVGSLVLPLVGPAALTALLARLARGHALPDAALAFAPLAPLAPVLPVEPSVDIGRGSLEARLRFDPDPPSRVAAVLATRRVRPPDAVRLLKLALRDRHEEVRLLAHALLDDRDRQAFGAIEALERALADAPPNRRASIELLLAEALCELCSSGLVTGELESFTLRRARALVEAARAARASAGAALVLGQVLLRQGEADAAGAAFEESGRLGTAPARLAPLLAEAARRTPARAQAEAKTEAHA